MNQGISLDLFRKNDLMYSMCQINYNKGCIRLPFVYNDYFDITTIEFMRQLNSFENTNSCPVAYNVFLLQIYTNYFACFEQFVSTLWEILYYYKVSPKLLDEKESLKYFRNEYNKTIDSIFKVIKTNKVVYNKTGLTNKIKELEDARNYILHGNIGRIKVKKTTITESPMTINHEDILEELNIIINFINCFRYIIPNIDLMPSVRIIIGEAIFFKKIDEYFYKVLVPYFESLLEKHKLYKTRIYELTTKSLPVESSSFAKKVEVFVKAIPEKMFDNIKMNSEKTNLYISALHNIIEQDEPMKKRGKFQLPAFMINTEEDKCLN